MTGLFSAKNKFILIKTVCVLMLLLPVLSCRQKKEYNADLLDYWQRTPKTG